MKNETVGRIHRPPAIDPDRLIGHLIVKRGLDAEAFKDAGDGQVPHGDIHHHPHGAGLIMMKHIDDRMGEIAFGHAGRRDQELAGESLRRGRGLE